MKKMFKPEQEPNKITPEPATLDVVSIDGRWAQMITNDLIVWLDSGDTTQKINWADYNYEPFDREGTLVRDLVDTGQLGDVEYNNVHWGPEEKESKNWKGMVTAFGRFTKKE